MQSLKILEQDAVLLSQPMLIEKFGRAGAQFLSQLHYWLEKNNSALVHNGCKWIYNTEAQWSEQLKLSARQIRRYISGFLSQGIIRVEKLHQCKSNRTNYYSIDYKKLDCLLTQENSKTAVNERNAHEDILSVSSGHNGPFYIQKTTNKNINKSEKNLNEQISKKSFEQVTKFKNKENCKEPVLNELECLDASKVRNDITPKSVKEILPKTNTAQEMLKIWNDAISSGEKMSKELAPLLVSAYNSKFSKDLEHWKTYVLQIKSSSYLTGEKFNLSIFWALKFSIIERIRAGEFGVKKDDLEIERNTTIKSFEEVNLEIEKIKNEPNQAIELRRKILQLVGVGEYLSWFYHATFITNNGNLEAIAPNKFVEDRWDTHYSWLKKESLS